MSKTPTISELAFQRVTPGTVDLHGPNALSWNEIFDTSGCLYPDHTDGAISVGVGPYSLQCTELVEIARPVMARMYTSVKGNGFCSVLADHKGRIIESIPALWPSCPHVWSLEVLGCNAIGTAITKHQPVQINGSHHEHSDLREFTSSAVPIYNQQGEIALILALVGPQNEDHSRVLSMLHKAVKIIVNKWKLVQTNKELRLYSNRLRDVFDLMFDGVVIVDRNGSIQDINQAALRITEKSDHDLLGSSLAQFFENKTVLSKMLEKGIPFADIELVLDRPLGWVHCVASGQASRDDSGQITGGMIVLHRVEQVDKTVKGGGTRARFCLQDIIGESQSIRDAVRVARLAANNINNVIIQGESGTGKEVFAQAIHNAGFRSKGPFIAINCGAIPKELIGSELFGYVDGAFTGARRGGKPGKFELAAGGTLFLDEIGDMPLDQQVVLLRVLQDKTVTRIGDVRAIPVDVRILCASNKDLLEEIDRGNFRRDLYYRLNVISITIASLRHRREDIPLLVYHYLAQLNVAETTRLNMVNSNVMNLLAEYHWPGNVRELQNVVERLVIAAAERPITITDLPPEILGNRHIAQPRSAPDPALGSYRQKKQQLLAQQEADQIWNLLRIHRGNHTEVAKAMGFSRTTLYRKIELYGISKDLL